MNHAPNYTRSAAGRARDTARIIGSLKHEGYVPTPEAEARWLKAWLEHAGIIGRGGIPAVDWATPDWWAAESA